MEDEHARRIRDDMEELKEQFEYHTTEELCEILAEYVDLVGKEAIIGVKEYQVYIEFLTEEINKRYYD